MFICGVFSLLDRLMGQPMADLMRSIPVPDTVRAALGRLRGDSSDYRWVDPASMHVTLAFLGEQPASAVQKLGEIGGRAAGASRPGRLRLGPAGGFGSRRAPRVLWVGLDGDVQAMADLQARLDTALRGVDLALEDRPFRAHITLARRRESAPPGPAPDWPPSHGMTHLSFRMHQLTLFQSRLSPRGPTYTPLFQFPLGSA
jgi:2'-5' RNA ligase